VSVEDLVGVWCDLVLALSGPGADLVDLVLDLVVIWCFWCMYGITSGTSWDESIRTTGRDT